MTIKELNVVQKLFHGMFRKIGFLVVRYPVYFILIPVLMTALLCSGFFWFTFLDDPEHLFSMTYGRAREDRSKINSLFPLSKLDHYDYGRETRIISGYARVLFRAQDGKSVFRPEVMKEVLDLNELIEKITVNYGNKPYDYHSACSRYFRKCLLNPVVYAFEQKQKAKNGTFKVKYPIYLDDNKIDFYFFGMTFGGVTLDEDGYLIDATLGHLVYFIDVMDAIKREIAINWEAKFLETLRKQTFKHIEINFLSSHSLPVEFVKAGNKAIPIFMVTASFMVAFSMLACMMGDCTKSKPWLGVLGCVSSLMGVLSGCGICLLFNIPFPVSNYAVPFVLVGIGIDDTFIFLAAWRNTNPKLSLEERIVETYVHSGIAITVTSLTNVISFSACVLTYIPGLQIFGVYSAVSCIFSYIYQVSFIGGALVLLAKVEMANKNGNFLFCKAVPKSQAKDRNFLYRLLFTGGYDPEAPDEQQTEMAFNIFFRDYVGSFLCNKYARALVLLSFMLYFSMALVGFCNLENGMEFGQLYPEDSYAHAFWGIDSEYLATYRYRVQVAISDTLDYSKPETQAYFFGLLEELRSLDHVSPEPLLTESWLGYYLQFLNESRQSFWIRGYNLTRKSDFYNCLRFVFFRMPQAQRFKNDIKFNENYSDIVASRFFFQLYNTREIGQAIKAYTDILNILDRQPYNFHIFQPLLIFMDTILSIKMITFSTILLTVVAILIVTFIFIPNLVVAVWVAFSIISIELGVVGYMHHIGYTLNPATMFGLLIYLGLSVDNASHITYAFVSSTETDPKERLKNALHHVGLPIFQGCSSTILGLSALALIPSYLYEAIYQIGIMVMIFSAFHSVALLPLLLSIFYREQRKESETKLPLQKKSLIEQTLVPILNVKWPK